MLIWGGIAAANLRNIKIMMNNILRCILKVNRNHDGIPLMSVNTMYKQLNLLHFDDIYQYLLLRFLHSILYINSELYNEYYVPLLPTHMYNTRNVRINLPPVRVEVERNSTLFQSCKLLNELSNELLEPQSAYSLKVKYKRLGLSKY